MEHINFGAAVCYNVTNRSGKCCMLVMYLYSFRHKNVNQNKSTLDLRIAHRQYVIKSIYYKMEVVSRERVKICLVTAT